MLRASVPMEIPRNRPRRVDAGGVGIHRTGRIEGDEGAVASAQEAVIHNFRVSIDSRNHPFRINAGQPGVGRARNVDDL